MRGRNSLCLAVLGAACLLSESGCGSGRPKIYKVTGKVTLDGQPLSGATVTFMPADPATGIEMATGISGSDGVYNLTTYNTNDGAMEGDYKILVTKSVPAANGSGDSGFGSGPMDANKMRDMMAENMKRSFEAKNKPPPPKKESEVPKIYSNLESTPLKAKVTSGGNTIEVPLKKGGGT